jgi:hypothetical protein
MRLSVSLPEEDVEFLDEYAGAMRERPVTAAELRREAARLRERPAPHLGPDYLNRKQVRVLFVPAATQGRGRGGGHRARSREGAAELTKR